jgi:twinkle protein
MSNLTHIEQVAERLDGSRRSRLREDDVDFDAYMEARQEDVDKIRSAPDFGLEVMDEFFNPQESLGLSLPWTRFEDKFRIRPGEVTVWAGFNGHMKSMVTGYVLLHLMQQGEKACIASFEMKPRRTLKRMATQAIGTINPTETYVKKFLNSVAGKLWLYDQQGDVSPTRVLGVIYYCAEVLGCKQILIDSMMKVVTDEDDYNGQKRFISRLCAAAKDLNIHIHLVHHSRKKDNEAQRPGKQDSKGSGSIVDQCDNFVSVYKFPKKDGDDEKPTHGLYVDKQRHGEWEGLLTLWFDEGSLQFKESERAPRKSYVQ